MKIKDAIKILSQYPPEEEIVFAYWDKSFFEDRTEKTITGDQWSELMDKMENYDWGITSEIIEDMVLDV